jgi:hypothetical protein
MADNSPKNKKEIDSYNQSPQHKGLFPSGNISQYGKIGPKPVAVYGKEEGIDGNQNVCSKSSHKRSLLKIITGGVFQYPCVFLMAGFVVFCRIDGEQELSVTQAQAFRQQES